MNRHGYPETLAPAPPANTRAVRHGVYSPDGRVLAPRAEAIADGLMALPHVQALDAVAAEEIGSLAGGGLAAEAEEENREQPETIQETRVKRPDGRRRRV